MFIRPCDVSFRVVRFLLPAITALATTAAHADNIAGRASVIDGDTIEIHGERIRILDIDAPEARQTCAKPDGQEWRCGQEASLALADWIGARTVTCESDQLDRYKRHLARCAVAGQDLGEWMAANGWVVPYRDCKCEVVRNAADRAKASRLGLWASSFVLPWEWRAQQAKQTTSPQPAQQPTIIPPSASQNAGSCQIKGNISSKGERIYHVPGGRWYDETKISESKGERWFCSEAEARAAGWRRSKQ